MSTFSNPSQSSAPSLVNLSQCSSNFARQSFTMLFQNFSAILYDVFVPSIWIYAPGFRRQILLILSAIHHNVRTNFPKMSISSSTMFVCRVLGLTPGCWRLLLFTHQLVLKTCGRDQVYGRMIVCIFQQLDFQCGQHVPEHLLIYCLCQPYFLMFVIASCKYLYFTLHIQDVLHLP